MNYRKIGADEILKILKSNKPSIWLDALACLDDPPGTYAIKLSLEKLFHIHTHLPVLLTRYHLKHEGKYVNVKLVAEVNRQWKALQQ